MRRIHGTESGFERRAASARRSHLALTSPLESSHTVHLMPSIYIAAPSRQTLEDNVNSFLAAMKSRVHTPQNALFTQIALEFVDQELEIVFFAATRQIELTAFRTRLVDALGGLIEKTAHGLIRSIIARLDNQELARLVSYVEDRRIYLDGVSHVSFPLPEHFTTRFQVMHEALMSGNVNDVEAQLRVINEFIDIALEYLLVKPTALIDLGFLARKGVALGHSSIRSLAHSTVRKLLTDVSIAEKQRIATYFYNLMLQGPDYQGA